MSSGDLDAAVQNECPDCDMTSDALTVEMSSTGSKAPTHSPTRFKRRNNDDDGSGDDDDDDRKIRNKDDDGDDNSSMSTTTKAVAAVLVVVIIVLLVLGSVVYTSFCHGENSSFKLWLQSERSKFASLPEENTDGGYTDFEPMPRSSSTSTPIKVSKSNLPAEVELAETLPSSVRRKSISDSIKSAQMEALGWEDQQEEETNTTTMTSNKGGIESRKSKGNPVTDAIYEAQLSGWNKNTSSDGNPLHNNDQVVNNDDDDEEEDIELYSHGRATTRYENDDDDEGEGNEGVSSKPKKKTIRSMLSPYQAVGRGKPAPLSSQDDDDEGEYDVPLSLNRTANL
jgi:hypothetical protein